MLLLSRGMSANAAAASGATRLSVERVEEEDGLGGDCELTRRACEEASSSVIMLGFETNLATDVSLAGSRSRPEPWTRGNLGDQGARWLVRALAAKVDQRHGRLIRRQIYSMAMYNFRCRTWSVVLLFWSVFVMLGVVLTVADCSDDPRSRGRIPAASRQSHGTLQYLKLDKSGVWDCQLVICFAILAFSRLGIMFMRRSCFT